MIFPATDKTGARKADGANGTHEKSPGPRPVFRFRDGWQDAIPPELTERDQWVVWRYELNVDRTAWTKMPYQCHAPQRRAETDNPETWNPYALAVKVYEDSLGKAWKFDGIGYVFAVDDPYVGADLDYSLTKGGDVAKWAGPYLARLTPSYAEVSPSGRGVKCILRGQLSGSGVRKIGFGPTGTGAIELYDRTRFFTITGDRFDAEWTTIEDRSAEVFELYRELKPKAAERPAGETAEPLGSDEDQLARARAAKNSEAFVALYDRGEIPPRCTASEADYRLCCRLAFWFGRNPVAIDRVFRQSKLMRDKWDSPRGDSTYGAYTIDNAIAITTEVYSGPGPKAEDPDNDWSQDGEIANLGDVRKAIGEFKYAWPLWIQPGSITSLAADAGTGKTLVALKLCEIVWKQLLWPDGAENTIPAGRPSMWLCYDRAWHGIMRAADAFGIPDEAILLPTSKGKPLWVPDLDDPRTIPLLERLIRRFKPWALVIDTMTYATSANIAKAHEAKFAYSPLMGVMAETGGCCISCTHLSTEGKVLNRRPSELSRTVLKLKCPDPENRQRLRFWVDKTDDRRPPALGVTIGGDGLLSFDDAPPLDVEDGPRRGRKPEKSTGFAKWLFEYLEAGPAMVAAIVDAARDQDPPLLKSPSPKEPKPSISPLYNAKERVERSYPGWKIEEFFAPSRKGNEAKHWKRTRVVDVDEEEDAEVDWSKERAPEVPY